MPSPSAVKENTAGARPPPLALFGGPKSVTLPEGDLFKWPIVTPDDESAVLDVLRQGKMSGIDITMEFEREFASWLRARHALAHNTGTAALHAAMFGIGLGRGDELISPALTYWASCLSAYSLGATVVFADVDRDSWCIDPADIERRVTPRTKAIVVVHYIGHPCDMDAIMAIARRRGVKVIEDVSHAQGGHYKGRRLGTIGDVAGISLMTGKSFPIGEGGMLVTNDERIYERALAFGHYERFSSPEVVHSPDLKAWAGLPLGGCKYRMHQMSSAVGRVQLRHYEDRIREIRAANDYFWSLLDGVPGLRRHQPPDAGSDMAGLYSCRAHYEREAVGGLSLTRVVQALKAEGYADCIGGMNRPLNVHPLFNTVDVYRDGKPTRLAFAERDPREDPVNYPVTMGANSRALSIPWFKKLRREPIAEYAAAFRKILSKWEILRQDDPGDPGEMGTMGMSRKP